MARHRAEKSNARVASVRSNGDSLGATEAFEHVDGCVALGVASRLFDAKVYDETVSILHQDVAYLAQCEHPHRLSVNTLIGA